MARPHPPRGGDQDSHLESLTSHHPVPNVRQPGERRADGMTSHHPLPNSQNPEERQAGGMHTQQRKTPATTPAQAIEGNQLIGRCHQIAEEEGIALSHIPGGCHEGGTCEIAQRLSVQRLLSMSGLQHVVGRDALLVATWLPLQPRASRRYRRARLPAPGQLKTSDQDETPLYKQMLRDRIV